MCFHGSNDDLDHHGHAHGDELEFDSDDKDKIQPNHPIDIH